MKLKEIKNGKNCFSGVQENGNYLSPETVVNSWKDGFIDNVANGENKGLRSPQFGALCAIRARWTISKNPITIVMPTGTGKSETMLATIVAEKIFRTLIIVPSNLLRIQIYEKACNWGVLYDSGNLRLSVLQPNVLHLGTGIKEFDDFKTDVISSNVIITTMSLVDRMSESYKNFLADACNLLIVDKAHHISSKTWSNFKTYFRSKSVLQFTATPFRADGKKIDGDIIYNYPLGLAQEQGYFQEIIFEPVEEFDERKQDLLIACKAVQILQQDINDGFAHTLLVRAKSIDRAIELYENVYSKHFSKYNPVLIVSKMSTKEKQKNMEAIRSLVSRIVVCVDMFGEGIDIPNLKVAAIHDKYKSMPITLQFIGRFARAKKELGKAKIVTNIADSDIVDAIKDMYEKDTDWNKLLPMKSNEYIDKEISLQEMVNGFDGDAKKVFSLAQMRPKVSMIAYHVSDDEWLWENWSKVFDESTCHIMVNHEDKILVIIEPREINVTWTTQQNVTDMEWEFYIVYWDRHKKIAFVNSSDKSTGYKLVSAIFQMEVSTIRSEQIFKCLYGIKRLALATVGLNSGIDGPVRYKMFAGIDVAQGISEANKNNCYKSNVFGIGYNGNGKVSIGCSYKGTVWSHWVESIDFWRKWCDETIDKVIDDSIDVSKVMDGVLIPKVITSLPNQHAYRIDWPFDLEFETERKVIISNSAGEFYLEDTDISLKEDQENVDCLYFRICNEHFAEEFQITINETGYKLQSIGPSHSELKIGNKMEGYLGSYFNENPPTIWYVDGSSIQGNVLIELSNNPGGEFPSSNIITWDWGKKGVNIRVESQLNKKTYEKKKDSIQFAVIDEMRKRGDYSIIFDDDGSGEIADVIGIKEKEKTIQIDLFHCKYSHGDNPGSRLEDIYEVCGQAEKSVFWKQKLIDMIERIKHREIKRTSGGLPSRFEIGNIQKLIEIKNKLLLQSSEMTINIVQPGIDSKSITPDMHRVLVTSQSYCMDTYSLPLNIICS